jgi:hypothetical protein
MKSITELKNNWNEIKMDLETKLALLTNCDSSLSKGKQDEMPGIFQNKECKTKEENSARISQHFYLPFFVFNSL